MSPHDEETLPGTSRRLLTRNDLAVIAFSLAYIVLSVLASWRLNNDEFVLYIVVMVVLMLIVLSIHLKHRLHDVALWGLSLWGIAHMAGGLMPIPESWPILGETHVLYNLWLVPDVLKYDQLIHAYGFGLTTWICWQGVSAAFGAHGIKPRASVGLMTLCAAAGMGFGALNEVVEFIATLALPETNVGGYVNTGWDLVSNLVGSIVAAVAIYIVNRGRSVADR